ncbi:RhoGAP-domain-containing protein [Violaceomyces palustris]|uniref:RhoGAP-domain-containing protein n=1 Tax=Violaceomyces palustris TaxID=1673888 RepID=A0ACD0P2K8_9BASI|nr:RhoGAP-domain-containing protein [Violaceomyces palustris]
MSNLPVRSPRPLRESSDQASATGTVPDNGSSTSHASTSRVISGSGTRSTSSSSAPQPLTLAEVLTRSKGDHVSALDEVLAERNKFCLDIAKLSSENVRIWTLMGRIRKENEGLKAKIQEMERLSGGSLSGIRASPLAPAASIAPSSPAPSVPARRRPNIGTGDEFKPSSPLASPRNSKASERRDSDSGLSTPQVPTSPRALVSQDHFLDQARSIGRVKSPDAMTSPTSISFGEIPPARGGPSNSTPVDASQGSAAYTHRVGGSMDSPSFGKASSNNRAWSGSNPATQQSSIMQQRALAQAQSIALAKSQNGHDDARNSMDSGDFEAVDRSSASGTDETGSVVVNDPGSSGAIPGQRSQLPNRGLTLTTAVSSAGQNVDPASNLPYPVTPSQSMRDSYDRDPNNHSSPASRYRSDNGAGLLTSASQSSLANSNFSRSPMKQAATRGDSLVSRVKTESQSGLTVSPRLDASLLRVANIRILGTNYRPHDRPRESISFFIGVEILQPPASWGIGSLSGEPSPPTSWTLEKMYGDIMALDARLKQKHGKNPAKRLAPLPDKSLFKDHAPSKVDQRKVLLEIYLQSLLTIQLPDKDEVCTFLCTDVVPSKLKDTSSTSKEGFLTKKGQNLGRWVTRYYSLRNSTLAYFETRGGVPIGAININGAQIGRQQRNGSVANEGDENSYRHAFLILERRPGANGEPSQMARHVLCAESDEERDEWVDVLVRAIAELDPRSSAEGRGSPRALSSNNKATVERSGSGSQSNQVRDQDQISSGRARGGADGVEPEDAARGMQAAGGEQTANYNSRRTVDKDGVPLSPSYPPMSPDSRSARRDRERERDRDRDADVTSRQQQQQQVAESSMPVNQSQGLPTSSSVPTTSNQRSLNITDPRNPSMSRGISSQDLAVSHSTNESISSSQYPASPELRSESLPRTSKGAISGPMNGAPIPTGYKFGGKDESASQSNEKKDDKKRFWQGFRGFGGGDKNSGNREPRPVFGVPLAESIAISSVAEGLELPSVVFRCIEYLEKRNAALEEGIYRLSGSTAVIKTLRERFNTEGDVNLLAEGTYYDPHAVAGLLKCFLRELPSSVLTRELHMEFMRVNELSDRAEKVNELGNLVSQLPLANYSLLRTLCSHLIKIIEHADVNKMTMRNVGIVFSPTLAISAGVFSLFLTEFDIVFFTDANGDPAPLKIEEEILPPDISELGQGARGDGAGGSQPSTNQQTRSKRNSILYMESQADKMLGLEGRRLSYRAAGGFGGVGSREREGDEEEEGLGLISSSGAALNSVGADEVMVDGAESQTEPSSRSNGHHDILASPNVAGVGSGSGPVSSGQELH